MCDCKILRTEGDIILGDRGDDLIFRMLEDGADAMTGRAVCVGMGAGIIEGDIAEQRDGSRIGATSPAITRDNVDLPEPFAPVRQMRSPCRMVRSMPSNAQVAPWS